MKIYGIAFIAAIATAVFCGADAKAQTAASKDAQYLAIVKAVADFKINDEEHLRNMEKLRQNKRFYDKLKKMLSKLSNNRTKDSTNKKVLDILENAGKELDQIGRAHV